MVPAFCAYFLGGLLPMLAGLFGMTRRSLSGGASLIVFTLLYLARRYKNAVDTGESAIYTLIRPPG